MSKLLGSSPLGLAFFSGPAITPTSQGSGGSEKSSTPGGGNSRFIKPHEDFSVDNVTESVREDKSRSAIFSTNFQGTAKDTGKGQGTQSYSGKQFTLDYGLGYQTFGDKRTIFTDNDKMPNTFYVYGERGEHEGYGGSVSLIDYIKSYNREYYSSNYIDQYSSIPKIIYRLEQIIGEKKTGGAEGEAINSIKLKYADFAYLKKLGVYPSNRLIIARRFPIGVGDDLVQYKESPLSVIPTWLEDGKSFVNITYGEKWESVQSVDIANQTGEVASGWNFGKDAVAEQLRSGLGIFSLSGFTEWLQYYLFEKSGLTDPKNLQLLPQGNPNIIRQAQTRQVFEPSKSFSGLNYAFSIDISTEYEIKYIDGVDPTLVYFDIISNLLRFGTSESQFQFDSRFSESARKMLVNLSSGDFKKTMEELGSIFGNLLQAANNIVTTVKEFILGSLNVNGTDVDRTNALLGSQIKKYRIKFLGIINALTGSPSGIYHVTIGNPLRPLFVSGDLIPKGDMSISLGAELGYNNLPTTIKFTCTLQNARPCGLQEIYKKFSPYPIRYAEKADTGGPESENYRGITLNSEIRRPRNDGSFNRAPVPSRNRNTQVIPNFAPLGPPPLSPRFPFVNP